MGRGERVRVTYLVYREAPGFRRKRTLAGSKRKVLTGGTPSQPEKEDKQGSGDLGANKLRS